MFLIHSFRSFLAVGSLTSCLLLGAPVASADFSFSLISNASAVAKPDAVAGYSPSPGENQNREAYNDKGERRELKGDVKAISRLSLMFEKLGGRKEWAQAKTMYVSEKGRHVKYGDGIVANFWHDLEQPGEKAVYKHAKLDMNYVWNGDEGWTSRDGKVRDFLEDEIEENKAYWQRDTFTLLHQLAAKTGSLRVASIKPNGIKVLDRDNKPLVEFQLTGDGELYLWQPLGTKKSTVMLFGPYKSFGSINFPDWGTAADGRWSSYFVQLMPSNKPFVKQVSLHKPHKAWQGGAFKKECE